MGRAATGAARILVYALAYALAKHGFGAPTWAAFMFAFWCFYESYGELGSLRERRQ